MHSTPWHFWIVVALGFVWQAIAALDYTAVQYDLQPWLDLMTQRQRGFVQDMPDWVDGVWGVSSWVGLFGIVLLAVRASFAPLVLGVSMIATVVLSLWLGLFSDPSVFDLAGWLGVATLMLSVLFAVLLWLYARDMHKDGVID